MAHPDLRQLMEYPLSDDDLRECLRNPNVRILTYPKLSGETLETLFGPGGYTVLLFLTRSATRGHWLCVLQHEEGRKIEVFDSFGTPVDGDRAWLDKSRLTSLHETLPLLGTILSTAKERGIRVEHNTHHLQADESNTCGRHVAARLMHCAQSLPDYISYLKSLGGTPDEAVTKITYAVIHK